MAGRKLSTSGRKEWIKRLYRAERPLNIRPAGPTSCRRRVAADKDLSNNTKQNHCNEDKPQHNPPPGSAQTLEATTKELANVARRAIFELLEVAAWFLAARWHRFRCFGCPQRFILLGYNCRRGLTALEVLLLPIRHALPRRRQQECRQNRPNKGNSQEDRRLKEVLV